MDINNVKADYSCLYCQNIYVEPKKLIKCGHSMCSKCLKDYTVNQQKLNCRLIDLKIDKVYDEMKVDELESIIIDLQQSQDNKKLLKNKRVQKKSSFSLVFHLSFIRDKESCCFISLTTKQKSREKKKMKKRGELMKSIKTQRIINTPKDIQIR